MIASDLRQSVSLRISVTDRCQLGCLYCRPAQGPDALPCSPSRTTLDVQDIAYFVKLIRQQFRLSKVHLTGGEPLLEPRLSELVGTLAESGLDLALTTNAQCLAKYAGTLKQAGLRRVNVSLDSLNPVTFAHMTRGGDVAQTQAGIERALAVGLQPVKLNMTVLRGLNDGEIEAVARYGLALGCETRFLELMPIGPARDRFDSFFVSAAEIRLRLEKAFTLAPVHSQPGQSAQRFRTCNAQGQEGTLGLVAPYTHPFCQGCRRLRLTRGGQLVTCLASGHAIDLRRWIQQRDSRSARMITEIVKRELDAKCMRGSFHTHRTMVAVGG